MANLGIQSVKLAGSNVSLDTIPLAPRDISIFIVLSKHLSIDSHASFTTVASAVYQSLPVDTSRASKVRVFLESTNQGTLLVYYTESLVRYVGDANVKWRAESVTGVLDPESGKYIYEWTKDAPIQSVKYKYTETASVGAIWGGVGLTEKAVV